MIEFKMGNVRTWLLTEDSEASSIVNHICTLKYEYWTRRWGSTRPKREVRDLYYYSPDGGFPTGWLSKITRTLKNNGIPHKVTDARILPDKIGLSIKAMPDSGVWEHQEEALIKVQEEKRGIVRIPTRGGKTLVMGLATASFNVRTLVLVPNKTLLDQEYEVFCSLLGKEHIGRLGNKKNDYHSDVIIATVQTLYSRIEDERSQELYDTVGFLCIDEAHHINSSGYELRNSYYKIAELFHNAYYRVGFTATPGAAKSLSRIFLEGATGKLIYDIDLNELEKRKIVTVATVKMVRIKRPKTRTIRDHLSEIGLSCPDGAEPEDIFRMHGYPVPYVPSLAEQHEEKILDSKPFRKTVKKIAEYYSKQGKIVLVITTRVGKGVHVYGHEKNEDGEPNEFYIKDAVPLESSSPNRTEVLDRMRNKEIKVLVTTLVREGIDIPTIDVAIMATVDVSDPKPTLQKAGRAITKSDGKEAAVIVDFDVLDKGLLQKHSKKRIKAYREIGYRIQTVTSMQEL